MSFTDGFISDAVDGLIDDSFAFIMSSVRSIGGIIPDCTFAERHVDRMALTEHPVQTGAAITDHAFRNPAGVDMKIGFSNAAARSEGWVQAAYQMLLSLQRARIPFDVYTGKRVYSNMMIDLLEVETDAESEFVLNCTVGLREVIIVSTAQASTGANPDPSQQAMPQSTQAPVDAGAQTAGVVNGVPTFAQVQAMNGGAGFGFNTIAGGAGFSTGGYSGGVAGLSSASPTGGAAL